MTWRYDVFECNNETADHNECEVMTGPPILVNAPWRDAYRKAESLSHGVVERRYTGDLPYKKTPHVVFEHIEGGGTCWLCGRGRGPLCKTSEGGKFLCEPCRREMRQYHELQARSIGTDPSRYSYVPIIDTVEFED
ncbi:hypothetical protein GPA10_22450 [Streptomyces sp. p1417]|uniref:Uncharacterized protein n=1 Tax=Streptomyces typhae TaxID=2681492 RepID=A0A6L6X171_9ACTN|nr:hypothetical protein [Streptomyces typhae]MVO87447.1 hypothetical protein [Streptomyces typhae]